MSRPRKGTIRKTRTAQGVSYAIRFKYRGQAYFHQCGGDWEGWDDARAEAERDYVMASVERGDYVPQRRAPALVVADPDTPVFQVAASNWLHRQKLAAKDPDGASKTIVDLTWRLTIVMDAFGALLVDKLEFRHASDLVAKLQQERLAIEEAEEEGVPLTEAYTDPRTGREHRRKRRGLSNGSIRKALETTERVLADCKARGELRGDVPQLKQAVKSVEKPRRSFLQIEQIVACLSAAKLLEAENRGLTWDDVALIRSSTTSAVKLGRQLGVSDTLVRRVRRREIWTDRAAAPNRNDIPRYSVFLTLVLAGPRVAELCAIDAPDIDTAAGRVRVRGTKTEAAERVVPLLPALAEALTEHRLDVGLDRGPAFPTRNGTRQNPDNVRTRIVDRIRERANELLEAEGRPRIEHLTPHTLRRTFASLLAICNVPPRRAMYLLGHADPKFTMRVYQQVLDVPSDAYDDLERLLGCTVDEARDVFSGRVQRGLGLCKGPQRALGGR